MDFLHMNSISVYFLTTQEQLSQPTKCYSTCSNVLHGGPC